MSGDSLFNLQISLDFDGNLILNPKHNKVHESADSEVISNIKEVDNCSDKQTLEAVESALSTEEIALFCAAYRRLYY